MSEKEVSMGQAAKELGVNRAPLRRWEAAGKIQDERTPKGHRRYDLSQWHGITARPPAAGRGTLAYARVCSRDPKDDLVRQVALLESFCAANGWSNEVIQDLGSGLNYPKQGLHHLLKRICNGPVGRLVLTHADRLLRFGSEWVFSVCEAYHSEVVNINQGEQPLRGEEGLAQEVLEIIPVFSARLYGSRSDKNRVLVETWGEAAEPL